MLIIDLDVNMKIYKIYTAQLSKTMGGHKE